MVDKLQLEINRIFHNLILPTLQIDEAIALCQESIVHPNTQTREQAQRILFLGNYYFG